MKDERIARIWTSSCHKIDGYYVEILGWPQRKKGMVIWTNFNSTWRPTIAECRDWAISQGIPAEKIEEYKNEC